MNKLPSSCNYIAAFLTMRCNKKCSYCINRVSGKSPYTKATELPLHSWIKGLSKIETRPDLPITLQGGEPTLYKGFFDLVNALYKDGKTLDLLTNGMFDVNEFIHKTKPEMFRQNAKYAGIRISCHSQDSINKVVSNAWALKASGYRVGIWIINHPLHKTFNEAIIKKCKSLNIDIRIKDFLGYLNGTLHGVYKYNGIGLKETRRVLCKTSEILIAPNGYIFACHRDLYKGLRNAFGNITYSSLRFNQFSYNYCYAFGECNPCDLKLKFDRFQKKGHCSVSIKMNG